MVSDDRTGSGKAAEMVLMRIWLNAELHPPSPALHFQELPVEASVSLATYPPFQLLFGQNPCPQLDLSQWEPKVKWQGG